MRSILCAESEAQDGLAAVASVAATEVLIKVRRFMSGILLFPAEKGMGIVQARDSTLFFDRRRRGARQPLSFLDDEEVIGGNIRHGFELSIGPVNFDQVDFRLFL